MKNNNKKAVFCLGALIGMAVFLIIYGISPLDVTNDSYILNGYIEKDITQHYSGWMLYRNSPWAFPVGLGQNIAYPYGNVVTYTDSIPLFAIFFKLFRSVLPATFQYFGLFVLLCFMLQGAFGALLINHFINNTAVSIMGAVVFVFTPVMIERAFRHCALTAHFLILSSLYYYFENKKKNGFKSYLPFIIITNVSLAIHPYFLPFTYGIMFAFCSEKFIAEKKYKESCCFLALSLGITVFLAYILGLFYVGSSVASIGYGFFNMNLNALYNPISKGFESWSAVLSARPNMYLQIEGFNYLGFGIIAFIPVAAILYFIVYKNNTINVIFNFIKKYFGIIFTTSALLIFAIGDWVRFGGLELFRIPFPDFLVNGIFGIFRANGRFGNMLVYMIVLAVLYAVININNQKISQLLLLVLICIQIYDLSPALISKYNYFHGIEENLQGQTAETVLHNSFWDDAAERFDYLYMISDCVPGANFELTLKFAKNNKAVNTRFDIKIDEEKFQDMEKDILKQITKDTMPENSLVLLNFIPDKYKDALYESNLSVYYAEGIVIVCNDVYSDADVEKFIYEGDFSILEYPYTVQAEIDFKEEYGL